VTQRELYSFALKKITNYYPNSFVLQYKYLFYKTAQMNCKAQLFSKKELNELTH